MALPNFNTLHKLALLSEPSASNVLVSFSTYFASSIYFSCHSSLWIIFMLLVKEPSLSGHSQIGPLLDSSFHTPFFLPSFSVKVSYSISSFYILSLCDISYFCKCIYYFKKISKDMSSGIHCMKDVKQSNFTFIFHFQKNQKLKYSAHKSCWVFRQPLKSPPVYEST